MSPESSRMIQGVSKSFVDRADSAAFYESWVGAVLSRAGLYTLHHPFEVDGKDHSQTWDLDVGILPPHHLNYDNGDVRRSQSSLVPVEVKSLSLTFLNPDTYPFNDVLICSQSSWLRKWPGKGTVQRDFILVSRPTGHMVWIPKGTQVCLGHEVHDSSRNETYKAVKTEKAYLRPLADFVDYVKE